MWVFEYNGQRMIDGNAFFDDFLRFMPRILNCLKEDMRAWWISEAMRETVQSAPDLMALNMDEYGDEMDVWPYDSAMKFLGNRPKGNV